MGELPIEHLLNLITEQEEIANRRAKKVLVSGVLALSITGMNGEKWYAYLSNRVHLDPQPTDNDIDDLSDKINSSFAKVGKAAISLLPMLLGLGATPNYRPNFELSDDLNSAEVEVSEWYD